MKFKLFGQSGLRVSELCLGTMGFGTEWKWGADQSTSKKIFDTYANAGGNFLDKSGKILGKHKGYPFYTIGQRKGLDIAFGKPVYVTAIDPENNSVVLGDEEDLEQNEMTVGKLNLIKYDSITPGMEAVTKIRYKDKGTLSNLYPSEPVQTRHTLSVRFYENAKGIAPGQSAVFYEGDDVIGGGIIQRPNN